MTRLSHTQKFQTRRKKNTGMDSVQTTAPWFLAPSCTTTKRGTESHAQAIRTNPMLKFDCPECTCKLQLNGNGVESVEEKPPVRQFVTYFLKQYCGVNSGRGMAGGFARFGKSAKVLLAIANNDIMLATKALDEISKTLTDRGLSWTLETIISNFPSWRMEYSKKQSTQRFKESEKARQNKCMDHGCNNPARDGLYCGPCLDMRR